MLNAGKRSFIIPSSSSSLYSWRPSAGEPSLRRIKSHRLHARVASSRRIAEFSPPLSYHRKFVRQMICPLPRDLLSYSRSLHALAYADHSSALLSFLLLVLRFLRLLLGHPLLPYATRKRGRSPSPFRGRGGSPPPRRRSISRRHEQPPISNPTPISGISLLPTQHI